MGQPYLTLGLFSEPAFKARAAQMARALSGEELAPVVVGLEGEFGSGKTTWVRGMLEGLGFRGQVPSPTYALVEPYNLGKLTLVHLDLYRLACPEDLEDIGVRDWLSRPDVWLLVEWPERAPMLKTCCDVLMRFEIVGSLGRSISLSSQTDCGCTILKALSDPETDSRNSF